MTDLILGALTLAGMIAVAELAAILAIDCALRGMFDNALFDAAVFALMVVFSGCLWRDLRKLAASRGQKS